MSVNKVTLLGNTCMEPEIKRFENGGTKVRVRLATNERKIVRNDGTEIPERTEYHSVIFTGKLAEIAEKYIHKGDKIYIEGKIMSREYEKNGEKRLATEIIARELELLGNKPKEQAKVEPYDPFM